VVSRSTYELLPEETAAEPLGPVQLKGRRSPVEALVVSSLPVAAPDGTI
jgi:class 3 adenylate cyclase